MDLASLKLGSQVDALKRFILPGCKTVLDVGCGKNSNLIQIEKYLNHCVGVDIFGPDLALAKKNKTYSRYVNADIRHLNRLFKEKTFDCVMAMDVIEHLTKPEAKKLMYNMEKIAKKLVLISTPNGFVHQGMVGGNKFQIHKCGFTSRELRDLGFSVIGTDGPKFLRGSEAIIKYQPRFLFAIIANLLTPLFKFKSEWSYSLIAFKYL
jgi:2-polyprenyl-3-methyl-5-hydroxy-6-metoxy-1,4-benzoquinol methylase